MNAANYLEIEQQEQHIIKSLQMQNSIYVLKKDGEVIFYIVRKRPLVNPSTGRCVGILINTGKAMPGVLRWLLVNKEFPSLPLSADTLNIKLSKTQRQISFCLLNGFRTRKEISSILSKITPKGCSEIKVKNTLQVLYNKFRCNTPSQLLDIVAISLTKGALPMGSFPTGNYPVDSLYNDE